MDIKIGFGEVDITPVEPTLLSGYYYDRRSTGVHDRLFSRTMAVSDGKEIVALCIVDLISVSVKLVAEVRNIVEKRSGIRPENVMIAAIHTHTAPYLEKEEKYAQGLPEKLSLSIEKALANLAPSQMQTGRIDWPGVQFIRRYRMKDGSVRTNPGIGNPDVLEPIGTVDPEILLLTVEQNNIPRGAVAHFALHSDTVGGTEISADWSYFLRETVRRAKGKDLAVLTPIGPSGDVNHWNVFKDVALRGFEETARIGNRIGEGVIKAWETRVPVKFGPLRAAKQAFKAPLRLPSEKELEEARLLMEQPAPQGVDFTMDRVEARRRIKVAGIGKDLDIEVGVLAFGNVAFVSSPCEYFSELGRRIKRASPFEYTFVCTHAGGGYGYIGEKSNYDEGGYEITSSIFLPGAGEMIADTAIELLRSLA